jgi:protoporphyrinogen IX oxidase
MAVALALHIAFLCVWSATLLFMPALFRQELSAEGSDAVSRAQQTQRWVYAFVMTPSALATVVFGIWLVFERGFTGGWLPVKLGLVMVMGLFHVYCGHVMIKLKRGEGIRRRWYYLALPILPALLITAITVLVTAKPF